MRRFGKAVAVSAVGLTIGFVAGSTGVMPMPKMSLQWSIPVVEAGRYVPSASSRAGTEIVFVYVGSSTCGWSNTRDMPDYVDYLKQRLNRHAQDRGLAFAAIGIARDRVVEDGLEHLKKFGAFDEVTTGRGWANLGVQRYVYGEMPGQGATPQVAVLLRRLDYVSGHVVVTDQDVLVRKVGVAEIAQWVADEAPLPDALAFRQDIAP